MNKAIAFTLLVGLVGLAYAAEDIPLPNGDVVFPPKGGPKNPHHPPHPHHGNLPFPVKTTPFPVKTTPFPHPPPPEPEETTPTFEPGVETTSEESEETTPEPVAEETTPEPETTTPEPEKTTPEPETTTPEPETTTPEPETTTPEPETTTPEPVVEITPEPVKINAMYKENRVNRRRSAPGVMDVHGDSVNVSPEVKTTVALMQDILAARANSAANSEANGGRRSSETQKTFTINV